MKIRTDSHLSIICMYFILLYTSGAGFTLICFLRNHLECKGGKSLMCGGANSLLHQTRLFGDNSNVQKSFLTGFFPEVEEASFGDKIMSQLWDSPGHN